MKGALKEQAITLREAGRTYSEILREVPVAKSTLSIWLRSVDLAVPQKQRITLKRKEAQMRGAQARRTKRLREVKGCLEKGLKDISSISARELWLIGVALYWAEGSKQSTKYPSSGMVFSNSDVRMVCVFKQWLTLMGVPKECFCYELYIHESRKAETEEFKEWWACELAVSLKSLQRVYYKKGNPKTNRLNTGDLYHGLLRIRVNSSTSLNRKVTGWTAGIATSLGDGVIGNTSAFEAEDSRIVP